MGRERIRRRDAHGEGMHTDRGRTQRRDYTEGPIWGENYTGHGKRTTWTGGKQHNKTKVCES